MTSKYSSNSTQIFDYEIGSWFLSSTLLLVTLVANLVCQTGSDLPFPGFRRVLREPFWRQIWKITEIHFFLEKSTFSRPGKNVDFVFLENEIFTKFCFLHYPQTFISLSHFNSEFVRMLEAKVMGVHRGTQTIKLDRDNFKQKFCHPVFYVYFWSLSNKQYNFYDKSGNVKNLHLVSGTEIWTHNLLNTNLYP